jgi:predicted RNA-binding protein YlxR (DUF448 family)
VECMAHVPQRRCVACGRIAPKGDLLRVVAEAGRPVADASARMPGRGAYVCRSQSCVARAAGRGSIARALRCAGDGAGPDGLADRLLAAIG